MAFSFKRFLDSSKNKDSVFGSPNSASSVKISQTAETKRFDLLALFSVFTFSIVAFAGIGLYVYKLYVFGRLETLIALSEEKSLSSDVLDDIVLFSFAVDKLSETSFDNRIDYSSLMDSVALTIIPPVYLKSIEFTDNGGVVDIAYEAVSSNPLSYLSQANLFQSQEEGDFINQKVENFSLSPEDVITGSVSFSVSSQFIPTQGESVGDIIDENTLEEDTI